MMYTKAFFALAALALAVPEQVLGRERWLERDGRAVVLNPRRFGQENPAIIQKLSGLCKGDVCGVLAGAAISKLLAASPECDQQDHADAIIDAAQQFDAATKAAMIAAAVEFRQAEKNTPPDFSTNPPTPRNSVFCQKAPKNPELNGLVQAQDPANGDVFFDPATKASVQRGAQANTAPFGKAAAGAGSNGAAPAVNTAVASASATACAPDVTVTVTAAAGAAATPATPAPPATNGAATAVGDFGSCSVPQIEFGPGFDNRRETSFRPVDLKSFNHGSAQAIGIITRAICDTLVNSCKADDAAKATCAKATDAANQQPAKTGAQADAFNAAFNIKTNFAAVQAIDDQGRPVGAPAAAPAGPAAAPPAAATTVAAAPPPPAAATPAAGTGAGNSAIGNFGKCSVPEIEFAAGFDNRKETSFRPVDRTSFPHDSAQNGAIITQFVCDTLVNSCGADQAARDTCAKARAAFDAATPTKSGAQADAFNAVFQKQTNFKAVAVIDNQGKVVA